ncbi:MAG: hypothetical protein PHC50_01255 [Candidatus Cloacimonetes bacterium]|nr:hypothetical protein [Candidatus Cloacimonadota bacterium]
MNKKYLLLMLLAALFALCVLSSCNAKDDATISYTPKTNKPNKQEAHSEEYEKKNGLNENIAKDSEKTRSLKIDFSALEPKMDAITASLDSLFVLQQKDMKKVQSLLFWNLIIFAISAVSFLALLGLSVYKIFFSKSKAVKPVVYSPQNKTKTPKTPWKWD